MLKDKYQRAELIGTKTVPPQKNYKRVRSQRGWSNNSTSKRYISQSIYSRLHYHLIEVHFADLTRSSFNIAEASHAQLCAEFIELVNSRSTRISFCLDCKCLLLVDYNHRLCLRQNLSFQGFIPNPLMPSPYPQKQKKNQKVCIT